jgi:hypothetical protein
MTSPTQTRTANRSIRKLLLLAIAVIPALAAATEIPALIDDFSDAQLNQLGLPRMVMDDTAVGGKSSSTLTVREGSALLQGELAPPRGQPAWVSLVFPLSADGSAVDLSAYEGVRLRILVQQGMLSLSVNSTEVVNFDYHAAPVSAGADAITELRIPFKTLKRAWSEPTPLNTRTVASISLVAVGLQPGSFAYEIEELGLY